MPHGLWHVLHNLATTLFNFHQTLRSILFWSYFLLGGMPKRFIYTPCPKLPTSKELAQFILDRALLRVLLQHWGSPFISHFGINSLVF